MASEMFHCFWVGKKEFDADSYTACQKETSPEGSSSASDMPKASYSKKLCFNLVLEAEMSEMK